MDELEKYIRSNRDAFEEKGPEDAVWRRLEKSLRNTNEKPEKKRPMLYFSRTFRKWVAVAAVFFLAVSFVAFIRTYQVKKELVTQGIPSDLRDARAYYTAQMDSRIAQIKRLQPEGLSGDSAVWNMLGQEDAEFERLRKALSENPDNPHVRAAFVEYYRSRLEVLKRIQDRLEQRKSPLKK